MKSPLALLSLIAVLAGDAAPTAATLASAPGIAGAQVETSFRQIVSKTNEYRFLLSLPKDYAKDPARKWPLVLFLHGAGERGTDVQKVAVHGPPKLVKQGRDFPFILASPQCPEDQLWCADALIGLVDTLQEQFRADPKRTYATGLSMGGYGTWSLALKYPDRFAAVAPICGGGDTIRALLPADRQALKSLGVWVFHGGKDTVVLPAESERMVDAFRRAGVSDLKLTVYPEAGHDSWTEAYNMSALYDWLLQHSR